MPRPRAIRLRHAGVLEMNHLTKACLTAVLLASLSTSVEAAELKVLAAIGDVTILRGSRPTSASARQQLAPGDAVQTANGSASVLLGRSVVHVGSNTRLAIESTQQAYLGRGTVRVANIESDTPFVLGFTQGSANLGEGVYEFCSLADGTRATSEQGTATIRVRHSGVQPAQYTEGSEVLPLDTGDSIRLPGENADIESLEEGDLLEDEDRRLNVDELQQQTADAAARDSDPFDPATNNQDRSGDIDRRRRPDALGAQPTFGSLGGTFGGLSASYGGSASGGLFADANQLTFEGMLADRDLELIDLNGDPTTTPVAFPGNIHLFTRESRYDLGIHLNSDEQDAIFRSTTDPVYYSIANEKPTTQVFTDVLTATDPTPRFLEVPGTGKYVVKVTQFGLTDAGIDPVGALNNNIGVTGLLGENPTSPAVFNADPMLDDRETLNETATFALGEFRLSLNGDSVDFAVRQSDQDRLIVKDPGGDDALDKVVVNPTLMPIDENFTLEPDSRFLPAVPEVYKPNPEPVDLNAVDERTRFRNLDPVRRAAATTVLADELFDFATRTGQTRFVVDGRVIDISGYQSQP